MAHIPLFLAAGAACCVALAVLFPQPQTRGVWVRYLFLLATIIMTAISTSFCYVISHYFLLFDWMSLVASIAFEAVILFSIFGMIFNLDYNEMGQAIKRRLLRK